MCLATRYQFPLFLFSSLNQSLTNTGDTALFNFALVSLYGLISFEVKHLIISWIDANINKFNESRKKSIPSVVKFSDASNSCNYWIPFRVSKTPVCTPCFLEPFLAPLDLFESFLEIAVMESEVQGIMSKDEAEPVRGNNEDIQIDMLVWLQWEKKGRNV